MKNKIITIVFLIVIIGLGFISVLAKDNYLSNFERRKLAQFPKWGKDFTSKLDDYLLDQFVFRNKLINLNSFVNKKVLNKIDNNDVYVIGDTIYDKIYPLDEKQVSNFTKKVNYIIDNYCKDSNVYYSIIPDKSKFLPYGDYLKLDYDKLDRIVTSSVKGKYININENLEIYDYYKTDIHWKQDKLSDVVEKIVTSMGHQEKDIHYTEAIYQNFYGASYSKAGTNIEPDELRFLRHGDFEYISANHLEFGEKEIYDHQKLYGLDSYDIFLSGASSYIELNNYNVNEDKTLILFRDSFGSSIAPLLTHYYRTIKIVDLRYIDFNYVKNMLDFENSDVLFLYSTLIINNGDILKVNMK